MLACLASAISGLAAAQTFAPRSMDYLFAATANDARAIWLNPAGLAVVPEASIMGEAVVERSAENPLRLSQLSVGFNSQGLSFGYHRERLISDSANHTFRVALARALPGWTIGVAVSHFRHGLNDSSFDVGIRYRVMRSVDLGVVLRNIGQPEIRTDTLPMTGVASLGWTLFRGTLVLTGETLVQNRLAGSGYDLQYRGGAQLSLGRAIPITGLTAVQLDSHLATTVWSLGIAIGRYRRGILVTGLTPDPSFVRLTDISFAAIATDPVTAWRR